MVRHAVRQARRIGVEQARRHDHGAVPREDVRAVVGDEHHGPGRQAVDAVTFDAEVPAVEERGHQEELRRRVEAEAEALGRRLLAGRGGRELRPDAGMETRDAPERGQAMPPARRRRRGRRRGDRCGAPGPGERHWMTIAWRA